MAESREPCEMDLLDKIAECGICQETLDRVEVDFELWQPIREESMALLKPFTNVDNHEESNGSIRTMLSTALGWMLGWVSSESTSLGLAIGLAPVAAGYGEAMGWKIHWLCQLETVKSKLQEDMAASQQLEDSLRHLMDHLEDDIDKINQISIRIRRCCGIEDDEAKQSVDNDDWKVFEKASVAAAVIEEYIRQVIVNKIVHITPDEVSKLKVALKAILRLPDTYMFQREALLLHAKALNDMAVGGVKTSALSTAKVGTVAEKVATEVAGKEKEKEKVAETVTAKAGTAFIGKSIIIQAIDLIETCVEMSTGSEAKVTEGLRKTCDVLEKGKRDCDNLYEKFKNKTL